MALKSRMLRLIVLALRARLLVLCKSMFERFDTKLLPSGVLVLSIMNLICGFQDNPSPQRAQFSDGNFASRDQHWRQQSRGVRGDHEDQRT